MRTSVLLPAGAAGLKSGRTVLVEQQPTRRRAERGGSMHLTQLVDESVKVVVVSGTKGCSDRGSSKPSWFGVLRKFVGDPSFLTIVAIVFLVSAVGQSVLQLYMADYSMVVIGVLGVLGSLFLVAAIVIVAIRGDRRPR